MSQKPIKIHPTGFTEVILSNLPPYVSPDVLQSHILFLGSIEEIIVSSDVYLAYVYFHSSHSAYNAVQNLDGVSFQGKELKTHWGVKRKYLKAEAKDERMTFESDHNRITRDYLTIQPPTSPSLAKLIIDVAKLTAQCPDIDKVIELFDFIGITDLKFARPNNELFPYFCWRVALEKSRMFDQDGAVKHFLAVTFPFGGYTVHTPLAPAVETKTVDGEVLHFADEAEKQNFINNTIAHLTDRFRQDGDTFASEENVSRAAAIIFNCIKLDLSLLFDEVFQMCIMENRSIHFLGVLVFLLNVCTTFPDRNMCPRLPALQREIERWIIRVMGNAMEKFMIQGKTPTDSDKNFRSHRVFRNLSSILIKHIKDVSLTVFNKLKSS
ncbi:hypothetical protein P9112_011399 [Eukaryota sp. TZLM1-RC]